MSEKRFIATQELGKLAKWLRILGFDCEYYEGKETADLVIPALREKRIVLTRSSETLKFKGLPGVLVKHDLVEDQLDQVVKEAGLAIEGAGLFRRCVECNVLLDEVKKENVKDLVPAYVHETQEIFKKCPKCGKIFWKGTHWDMVEKWLKRKF